MSPFSLVALIALLVGVLLLVVALIVWQEARRRPSYEPLEYVIDDAVKHIMARLEQGSTLTRGDVTRILEWEIFYLQGLAQDDRKNAVETIAGGHAASIDYIATQIEARHGVAYSHDDIEQVLRLEADYLAAIGAVGDPVEEEE
jgi:hypothetical protein